MAWRGVCSFVSSDWPHGSSDADVTHSHFKPLFEGGRRPPRSTQRNFRRGDLEVIAFN